jgi:hypothetical protein
LQDHRAFDWLAVQAASRVVAQVRPEHLDQPFSVRRLASA